MATIYLRHAVANRGTYIPVGHNLALCGVSSYENTCRAIWVNCDHCKNSSLWQLWILAETEL